MAGPFQTQTHLFTGENIEVFAPPAPDDLPGVTLWTARHPLLGYDPRAGSRLGDPAWLPPGRDWPRGRSGPLAFVGQLDFAELAGVHGCADPFPQRGLLGFFYDAEASAWGAEREDASEWALLYVEDPAAAVIRESPVRPHAASRRLLGKKKNARADGCHRVGGEPHWLDQDGYGRDVRYDVQCLLESVPTHAESLRATNIDVDALVTRASTWRVLWQLESDSAAKMSWVDDGTLSVLIREQDLRDLKFDQAWVVLQST